MAHPAVQDRSEASVNGAHRSVEDALAVLRLLFPDGVGRDFDVAFWDGTRVAAGDGSRFTLRVLAPFALRAALTPPLDLNPGRAFVEGWIEIDGDAEAAVDALERAVQAFPKPALPLLAARLLRLPRPPAGSRAGQARLRGRVHSRGRDAAAIGFHYDQPLEFYAAFLDPRLVYSCAYFETPDATLEQAQLAKIDYILRKLRLAPGERLLDIGCGWGALVMRAAERYGAHALGITLSEPATRRGACAASLRSASTAALASNSATTANWAASRSTRSSASACSSMSGAPGSRSTSSRRSVRCARAACSSITASPTRRRTARASSADSSTATSSPTANWSRSRTASSWQNAPASRCATSRTYASTTR